MYLEKHFMDRENLKKIFVKTPNFSCVCLSVIDLSSTKSARTKISIFCIAMVLCSV